MSKLLLSVMITIYGTASLYGQADWHFYSDEVPAYVPDYLNNVFPLELGNDEQIRVEPPFVAPHVDTGVWRLGQSFVEGNVKLQLPSKQYPVKLDDIGGNAYQLMALVRPEWFRDLHTMFSPRDPALLEGSRVKMDVMYYFDFTIEVDDFGAEIHTDSLSDRWLIVFQLWQSGTPPFHNPPIALHLHNGGGGLRWLLKQNTEQLDTNTPASVDLGEFLPNTEYRMRLYYRPSVTQNGHIAAQMWQGPQLLASHVSDPNLDTTHPAPAVFNGFGPVMYWGTYLTSQARTLNVDGSARTEGIQVNFDNMSLVELTGDLDQNASVDANDIDLLRVGIVAGTDDPRFDLNGDFQVNNADVDELVTNILHTAYGDANLDGVVNGFDFLNLRANLGQPGGWAEADFDGNGTTNGFDFLILRANLGFGL